MNTYIWVAVIILLIGVGVGMFSRKKPKLIVDQAREKAENIEKILDMLERMPKVTNDGIQKQLRVGDATVTRYMQELESQGTVRQVGVGSEIYYEKIQ